jgi:uncharacterized cupin superfamily protein
MPVQAVKFATGRLPLGLCPIRPAWILEGNPVARNKLIAGSADGTSSTLMWDCTAGRFNWHYQIDETICVVEGSVTVRDHFGATRTLVAGDTAFFPAGSSAEWTVDNYVRKIAFMRQPLPRPVLWVKRVYRLMKRVMGKRVGDSQAPAMSPTI